ncbi:MAG: hypothetical protein AVDCRST_MAG93-4355 [uncultured Chloroflexia bacterium]|uniref:Uncharacterized protein n=1 Tax=uncultured Chloroflexia bacterium TaxID=1672391 RepID=A0A6J4K6E4_9CHLR|nr:MAG: hypothetical protein AVDCRST_MAG93-4355 [uncultured Chloroflexia bacterium]
MRWEWMRATMVQDGSVSCNLNKQRKAEVRVVPRLYGND